MALMNAGYAGYTANWWTCEDADGAPILGGGMECMGEPVDLCTVQLHYCDTILVKIWIDLPQTGDDPDFPNEVTQGQSYSFSLTAHAIQWNEFDQVCDELLGDG
jgi:hypothetical protein